MTTQSSLLVDHSIEDLLILTLNRPEARNAIDEEMIEALTKAMALAQSNLHLKAVILKANGPSFCAGGDVKAMKEKRGMFEGESWELMHRYQQGIQRIPLAFEACQVPIIALIEGAAVGAGCDLALMADWRIGNEKASFAETFPRLSLVPGDGGTYFLTRALGYSKAMQMLLTGRAIKGKEAYDFGLLQSYTEGSLDDLLNNLLLELRKNKPLAMRYTKTALKEAHLGQSLPSQLTLLSSFQGIAQRTPDHFEALKHV